MKTKLYKTVVVVVVWENKVFDVNSCTFEGHGGTDVVPLFNIHTIFLCVGALVSSHCQRPKGQCNGLSGHPQ